MALLDKSTQLFAQGASAGRKVREAHAETPVPAALQRSLYWFYVGALAAGEYGCTTQEDFSSFILGAATAQPATVLPPPQASDWERSDD